MQIIVICNTALPDRWHPATAPDRTQHAVELFGEDWALEGLDPFADTLKDPGAAGAHPTTAQ
jgi:hypothetical protein